MSAERGQSEGIFHFFFEEALPKSRRSERVDTQFWCLRIREEEVESMRKVAQRFSTRAVGTNAISNINVVYRIFM